MHAVSMLPELVLGSCGLMYGLLDRLPLSSSGSALGARPGREHNMALKLLAKMCCCCSVSC